MGGAHRVTNKIYVSYRGDTAGVDACPMCDVLPNIDSAWMLSTYYSKVAVVFVIVALIGCTFLCSTIANAADTVTKTRVAQTDTGRTHRAEPGRSFRDCDQCPEMVVLPAGQFMMGSPADEVGRDVDEGPQRNVKIAKPFAVGKFEVTWAEWDACVADKGCDNAGPARAGGDNGWGKGRRPLIEASWHDAKAFVSWLSEKTGKPYRLLTEAEWEYAARAGTTTPFHFGTRITPDNANYDGSRSYRDGNKGTYREKTIEVGAFPANAFGLHDTHGNVWEWVEDCYKKNYVGAPDDGQAIVVDDCRLRVLRSGSWFSKPGDLRSAVRNRLRPDSRLHNFGFRVARDLE